MRPFAPFLLLALAGAAQAHDVEPGPGRWAWRPVSAAELARPAGPPPAYAPVVRDLPPITQLTGAARPYTLYVPSTSSTPVVGTPTRFAPVVGAPRAYAPVVGAPNPYAAVVGAPNPYAPVVGAPPALAPPAAAAPRAPFRPHHVPRHAYRGGPPH